MDPNTAGARTPARLGCGTSHGYPRRSSLGLEPEPSLHQNGPRCCTGHCPSWARTRTLLSQRGGHKPPNSSNLQPFTRLGVLLLGFEGLHAGVCAPPRNSKSALERERPLAGVAGDSGDRGSEATSFAMRTADVHMETGSDGCRSARSGLSLAWRSVVLAPMGPSSGKGAATPRQGSVRESKYGPWYLAPACAGSPASPAGPPDRQIAPSGRLTRFDDVEGAWYIHDWAVKPSKGHYSRSPGRAGRGDGQEFFLGR